MGGVCEWKSRMVANTTHLKRKKEKGEKERRGVQLISQSFPYMDGGLVRRVGICLNPVEAQCYPNRLPQPQKETWSHCFHTVFARNRRTSVGINTMSSECRPLPVTRHTPTLQLLNGQYRRSKPCLHQTHMAIQYGELQGKFKGLLQCGCC